MHCIPFVPVKGIFKKLVSKKPIRNIVIIPNQYDKMMTASLNNPVIPAEAGRGSIFLSGPWIPASAGMAWGGF
jgi:hypothetical protein